jgi:hypothetical protein
MSGESLDQVGAESLAEIFDAEPESSRIWRPGELASIFRHQLASSIESDLIVLMPDRAHKLSRSCALEPGLTYAQLFSMFHPPEEVLEAVKDLAKSIYHEQTAPIPREIGKAIYFATLAAAKLRLGNSISQIDEQSLRRGCEWAVAQPWLSSELMRVMQEWLDRR